MEKKEELSMKTKIAIMVFVVTLAVGMYAPACFGYSVELYDWVKFHSSYGNLTGELTVEVSDYWYGPYTSAGYSTFCLEINESLSPYYVYQVNDISEKAIKGGETTYDPIDPRTAYLYYNFFMETLSDYDYTPGAGRVASADALQIAIWYLENEITNYDIGDHWWGSGMHTIHYNVSSGVHSLIVKYLDDAAVCGWTDIGTVRAVNIANFQGCLAQSTLIAERVITPEPMTISLLGLGILGLGLLRRRIHR
jgi:hypothetical protein